MLERINLAVQQPAPIYGGGPVESDFPKKIGFLTLVQPVKRGEMIRVSFPVGEYVSRAFKGVAAVNHRRQERAAKREVAEAVRQFEEHRKSLTP